VIDEIIASNAGGQLRIALREVGWLMEVLTDDGGEPGAVGDIILGRVSAVLKGMDACFVEIGAEKAGFLSLSVRPGADDEHLPTDIPTEGSAALVQVTKTAQMGKGSGLTRNISIAGRFLVLTPFRHRIAISRRIEDEAVRARLNQCLEEIAGDTNGFIVRTAAADATAEDLAADARDLCARWQDIQAQQVGAAVPACLYREGTGLTRTLRDRAHKGLERVIVDTPAAFDAARAFFATYLPEIQNCVELWDGTEPVFEAYGIEDDIADALEPEVVLPCGGTIMIEQTHACATMDVNTGRNTGHSGHAATVLATNLEAAEEITRQLRLRNLGGLTVIDFVHMDSDEDREQVLSLLNDGLAEDPAFIRGTGFSELGLIELARRRGQGSLADRLGAAYDTGTDDRN
jgi:ribonuclease G